MADRIAVIDFETANNRPNSACQIGIVVLEDWSIVEEREWLIRPQRLYFSPMCVRVHGLTARDCLDAPEWDSLWHEIERLIAGCVVLAHNVGFDAAVLQATCQSHDIAVPSFDLQCTRLIGRRSWSGLPSYGLAALAEHLHIRFRHHNALEDARACARIAIEAAKKANADSLEDLEEALGLVRGRLWFDQMRLPRTIRRSRMDVGTDSSIRKTPKLFRADGNPSASTIERIRHARLRADAILANCQDSKPLEGKAVVLVNTLLGLDREEAVHFLTQLGAKVQSQINLQTHFLIMGLPATDDDPTTSTVQSTKQLEEVASRNQEGQQIRILSQRQLLACIPSALSILRGDG
jgi:DNA polymerase-3 subunit epsilon